MSYVFTSQQFIDKLKWLVNSVPNVYHSGKGWSERNSKGQVQFDCVVSVKCILWNFRNDYKINKRGGTVYKSNGVPDFPCNAIYDVCTNVSKDFSNLTPGEYLCMKDTKYNHTGIYLGDGKVFEDTTGWGANRAIISNIDSKGNRSYNGKTLLKWTYHGKLKYIDYSDTPSPTPTKKLKYQSHDLVKKKWLPTIYIGTSDYVGNPGNAMDGVRVEGVEITAHDNKKGYWLPTIKSYNDYAGNLGNKIDGIALKSLDPNIKLKYRVQLVKGKRWLGWVDGYNTKDSKNGYAGNLGQPICCLQIAYK